MAAKITRDVLESYLFCKYKSYLKLTGQQGVKSDYETLLKVLRSEVRLRAIDKILSQYQENQLVKNIPLTTAALKCGPLFIVEPTLEDASLFLSFDGLKRVPCTSKLGEFLYIPMLFHEGPHVRKEQRLLLELHGLLLSRYQAIVPDSGIIWHGRECKATKVTLESDLRTAKQILLDLKEIGSAEVPPKLVLNQHCQICEFRQRCRD